MSKCAWDDKPVAKDGDVCDLDCYSVWHAWMAGSDASDTLVMTDDGRLVILADDGGMVSTMEQQPWYGELVGSG